MIPTRLYVVPEILLSQAVPSEEVRMVPTSPTVTNNPLVGTVTLSSLPPHEIMVILKRNTEKIMKVFLTWFSIGDFGRTQNIPELCFNYNVWNFTWRVYDFKELLRLITGNDRD